jgi:ATP-dependent DNA ligase
MVSGILDGKEVRSKWTTAKPKNIGRANGTTGQEQADLEIEARYTKKLKEDYYRSIEEAEDSPGGNFFQPMLAKLWEKLTDKFKIFPLIADPKLDGMRLTILQEEKISRKGLDMPTAIHIVEELKSFFVLYPNIRLDGELYNHDFKEDFNELMSIARKVKPTKEDLKIAREKLQFHVYDYYNYDDPNLTALERKTWLSSNLVGYEFVKVVPYVVVYNENELDKVKEEHLLSGYEGTITRQPKSPYETKRSSYLAKHKEFITEEFKVVDILAGKGNRSGIAGTIEVDVDGVIVRAGIRGSYAYADALLKNKDNYIGKLATMRHFGKTPDGSLRFPVCIDINRPD